MNIKKWLIITTVFGLSLFVGQKINAQEENVEQVQAEIVLDDPSLFVLDTCPHCNQLLENLEGIDYSSIDLSIIEITPETDKLKASKAVSICGLKSGSVPLLYENGSCYVGRIDVENRLNQILGEQIISTEITESTDTTDFDDFEVVENDVPTSYPEEEQEEGSSLADRIDPSTTQRDLPEISPFTILIAVLAPAVFIGLTIYLLKKFKL